MFPLLSRDGLRIPYFALIVIFISCFILYLEAKKNDLLNLYLEGDIKDEIVQLNGDDVGATLLNVLIKDEARHQKNLELLNLQLKITRQKKELLDKFPALYGTFDKNESPLNMLYEEKRILDKIMKDLENHHLYLSNFAKRNIKTYDNIDDWKDSVKKSFQEDRLLEEKEEIFHQATLIETSWNEINSDKDFIEINDNSSKNISQDNSSYEALSEPGIEEQVCSFLLFLWSFFFTYALLALVYVSHRLRIDFLTFLVCNLSK
jgi:hypothetical protein